MKRRIVFYHASRFASDEELLAEIESCTGAERSAVAKLLQTQRAVFLNELDETGADRIGRLLEARHVEFDLESSVPESDKAEWLAGEIPKWIRRGFVHPAAAASVCRNYGLKPPPVAAPVKPASDPRTLVRAVLALGAVLIGLGLILFVASNWDKIPDAGKISGSLLLTLVALTLAHRLETGAKGHPRLAAAFYLIALFGIGGVLLLVAQTYHVVADSYLLPLVWGGLCLPVALLQRFKPALYLASGLWLWSYWLHVEPNDHLLWLYPFLLLGFLLPWGYLAKDRVFVYVHLGVLMLALVSTLATEEFWLCSVWVAALIVLRILYRKPLYDWLLLTGFLFWHVAFYVSYELPNYLLALPVAYFFYRAWKGRSNWLMMAAAVNCWIWLLTLFLAMIEHSDLQPPSVTGFLLWTLATGLLFYGIGARARAGEGWKALSVVFTYGGAALAALMVYVLSFRFYAEEAAFFASSLFLWSAVAGAAVGIALAAPSAMEQSSRGRWGPLALLGLISLSLGLSLVVSPSTGLPVVLFNLVLFVLALALMLRGHRAGHLLWYNAGIGLFVVLIVSRYFDTFVDLLPRSVFFLLGGAFLIGWAVLVDRQRKRRVAREAGDLG